ncbi:hypothetical protein TYRP_005447 [Tyrophagus putrescentiae]|nr:hypothetical protein TYRP_005447 [Tyrophagus putrescentiae]
MAKSSALVLFLVIVSIVVVVVHSQVALTGLQCGTNARKVEEHLALPCYTNCGNRFALRGCQPKKIQGAFCECNEGFIFKESTNTGNCVKAEDC